MQRACLEHLPALPGRQSRGLRTRVSRLARTGTPRTTESPLSNLGSGLSPVHRACAWWASRAQDCIAGGRPGMAGGTSEDPPRTSVAITRRKRCLGASLSIQAPRSDNRPVRGGSARTPPSRVQVIHVDEGFDLLGHHVRRVPWKGKRVGWTFASKTDVYEDASAMDGRASDEQKDANAIAAESEPADGDKEEGADTGATLDAGPADAVPDDGSAGARTLGQQCSGRQLLHVDVPLQWGRLHSSGERPCASIQHCGVPEWYGSVLRTCPRRRDVVVLRVEDRMTADRAGGRVRHRGAEG